MRVVLAISALLSSAGALGESPQPPKDRAPIVRDGDEITDGSASRVCRDRIDKAREERGLPQLKRDDTSSDDPLFIAAVDERVGGCSVMVMRNNLSDIRPLPQFRDGPAQLKPLGQ